LRDVVPLLPVEDFRDHAQRMLKAAWAKKAMKPRAVERQQQSPRA